MLCFLLFSPSEADVQLNGKEKKTFSSSTGRGKLVKMLIWFLVCSVNHLRELEGNLSATLI